jgi:hypothetical protein
MSTIGLPMGGMEPCRHPTDFLPGMQIFRRSPETTTGPRELYRQIATWDIWTARGKIGSGSLAGLFLERASISAHTGPVRKEGKPMDQEVFRYGKFAVLDRGTRLDKYGRLMTRGGRYAVVERDANGPILREGPFNQFADAREQPSGATAMPACRWRNPTIRSLDAERQAEGKLSKEQRADAHARINARQTAQSC